MHSAHLFKSVCPPLVSTSLAVGTKEVGWHNQTNSLKFSEEVSVICPSVVGCCRVAGGVVTVYDSLRHLYTCIYVFITML